MKTMQKLAAVVLGVVVLSAVFVGVASAQQFPNVTNLVPFTSQTHFMSLPGYLRYVTHQQGNQWLTYAEAARIVQQQ